MSKTFIDKITLKSKELTRLTLEKKQARPSKKPAVFVQIKLKTGSDEKTFTKDEIVWFAVEIIVQMYSRDLHDGNESESSEQNPEGLGPDENPDNLCFQCEAEIMVHVQFQQDAKYKEPLLPRFAEEVVSLAYDDFRIIIEDSINRTSFRGFYLPDDFRDIASKENLLPYEK